MSMVAKYICIRIYIGKRIFAWAVTGLSYSATIVRTSKNNESRPMPLFRLWCFLLLAAPATARAADAVLMIPTPERTAYLLSFWLVDLKRSHPEVGARLDLGDANASADALIHGRAQLVVMTRPLSGEEIEAFSARFGHRPTAVRVAHDALRVYVHRNNPLAGITLPQLDAVFSTTRNCGVRDNIFWWDQLGLDGDWKVRQIELYGPNGRSGARGVFAAQALCSGAHKATLEMAPTARDLALLVARNPAAIAYGSAPASGYGVRELPVASRVGGPFVAASADSIRSHRYPLTHDLYVYLGRKPGAVVSAPEAALLELALSPEGQARAALNGFVPLGPGEAETELAKLH